MNKQNIKKFKYNNHFLNKKKNSRKFNLFFKLLFLLPNISIKPLFKLVKLIRKLSYNCRKNLLIKIYRRFQYFQKNYLINFLKKCKKKKFKSNIITYKIKGTFLFLDVYKKNKKGLTYLKYNKKSQRERFQEYDVVSWNHNLNDFSLYQSFFLKNSKIKWDLAKLTRRKFGNTIKYKYAYKSIFIWPFHIIIKPFNIIIKNIYFKPFFVFKKWFKKLYNIKFFNKNKFYSQIYNLIVITVKGQKAITNIVKTSSSFYWYLIQKYYLYINISYSFKYKNVFLSNQNIFYRKLKNYKKNKKNKKNYKKIKKNKERFFVFFNFFNKYKKQSFIGLSFFLRLYCLYFFWFLYFINKIFYYINKILFNYWFRFLYFTFNINDINNLLFISFKTLYKKIEKPYNFLNYFEFENMINNYIKNIHKIIYWNINYLINLKIKNNYYKDYFLLMFFFYFNNYFFLNVFYNYNILFNNNYKRSYNYNNNFFDLLYIDNYKYRNLYKLGYFTVTQKLYKKYPEYYKINQKKLLEKDVDGKKNYLDLMNKRNNTLLLR